MDSILIWLFFSVALGIGWSLGRYGSRKDSPRSKGPLLEDDTVKRRLKLLFESYDDDTISNFSSAVEVSEKSLPLHLAIGKHFRREGEVDKAIQVHQNLMGRPELNQIQAISVTFELAKDYNAAGLFDRAEALLLPILGDKAYGTKSTRLLLDIYQKQGDWIQAIELAGRLDIRKEPSIAIERSQYCCELAESYMREDNLTSAKVWLKKAAQFHSGNIRAQLLSAQIDLRSSKGKQGFVKLKYTLENFADYFVLIYPLLVNWAEEFNGEKELLDLLEALFKRYARADVLVALVDQYLKAGDPDVASSLLESYLSHRPQAAAIAKSIELNQSSAMSVETKSIQQWFSHYMDNRSQFCCHTCGFESKKMYWRCPSCSSWETIMPLSTDSHSIRD